MSSFMNTSKPFEDFGHKAERFLAAQYPEMLDSMNGSISIGRNRDASAGQRGGYRISGDSAKVGASYLEVPDKILPLSKIKNREDAGVETFTTRVSDTAKALIIEAKQRFMEAGANEREAEKRVTDSLKVIGHYDAAVRKYVAEPMIGRNRDSMLQNLSMPYWDVSYTTKVFKQPFIEGMARNLVDIIGVPNIWADAIVMYAETFEGMARISGVAQSNAEHNDSAPVRNRFGMLVSEFVNMVVDYETGYHESLVGAQPGNFLTPMGIGDRERYGRLMLEQLTNAMWLFGATEAGFEGLSQMVVASAYSGASLKSIWADGTNLTKGATAVIALQQMIGDMQEALNFLPSSVRINLSPTAYKVLKWTMQSNVYSSKSPLQILSSDFKDYEMIKSNGFGTGVEFGKGLGEIQLVSDPFCAANTPWNATSSDLMFITFPTLKSALDPQEGVVIAPVAIENMILPSFPQRDGLQRTMLRRIGSIIAPVTGTIALVTGFGTQTG